MPVFDEQGNEIAEDTPVLPAGGQPEPQAQATPQEPQPDEPVGEIEERADADVPEGEGKYRIGDQTFNTLEEAHAFATNQLQSLQSEVQVSEAYRRGIQDALARGEQPGVTPETEPEDDFDEEAYYANPKEFLKRYGQQIEEKAAQKIQSQLSEREQSDQIWREFTERHPQLADFRAETEQFVQQNLQTVQGLVNSKGRPASYDFIALKLREQFNRYAQAVRPARTLPNQSGGASPSGKASGVTPKAPEQKPLSFREQLRSIRKRG